MGKPYKHYSKPLPSLYKCWKRPCVCKAFSFFMRAYFLYFLSCLYNVGDGIDFGAQRPLQLAHAEASVFK
ncbi:hypothetical protein CKAN_01434300 [Cinnamomum micranthum f. kanehirae]|uniref:Uncharacterized protein n=1 Tax=Cinnamomum micranthum f. kanehirae TaxID=337451 RepID=A0A443P3V3_9MAGN|nr:hypothetical protein CKAN_01434300 [Cinnamomum micranthum f. kanehirae]